MEPYLINTPKDTYFEEIKKFPTQHLHAPNPLPFHKHQPSLFFHPIPSTGMKISDISVDISPIFPISVMFDTISAITDISLIYRFWTDIS